MPWSPDFVISLPPRNGFFKLSEWSWNMIHLMSRRNPCWLYMHLAFTYSVGPSSVVWSELEPASPFPPMRVLEVEWSRALSPVCEVALRAVARTNAHGIGYHAQPQLVEHRHRRYYPWLLQGPGFGVDHNKKRQEMRLTNATSFHISVYR